MCYSVSLLAGGGGGGLSHCLKSVAEISDPVYTYKCTHTLRQVFYCVQHFYL